MNKPLFNLGKILVTPGVFKTMNNHNVSAKSLLERHVCGDWGDMCQEDKELNDDAAKTGETRIFSSYNITPDVKIWLITEWDRSVTTLLLPEEY